MDRNIASGFSNFESPMSLSARRAWIEISGILWVFGFYSVALRKESVDRNFSNRASILHTFVALRKESVDRNWSCWMRSGHTLTVALRKESVDRNLGEIEAAGYYGVALRKESVDRNASFALLMISALVALRKESVDRNQKPIAQTGLTKESLSARRAWIEMVSPLWNPSAKTVALRKESVDRNLLASPFIIIFGVALRKESVDRNW